MLASEAAYAQPFDARHCAVMEATESCRGRAEVGTANDEGSIGKYTSSETAGTFHVSTCTAKGSIQVAHPSEPGGVAPCVGSSVLQASQLASTDWHVQGMIGHTQPLQRKTVIPRCSIRYTVGVPPQVHGLWQHA